MRYHNISKDDMLNGDGLRAVLFVSGCTHHCPKCHNPITWDKESGIIFDDAAKKELFDYLSKDYVSGITFSGGDPLAVYNREEVLALIEEVKEKFPNKTVWVYSGWTKDELIEQGFWDKLSKNIDVFVEGKFEYDKLDVSYNWAGSTNQRVLRKESDFTINTSDRVYIAAENLRQEISRYVSDISKESLFEKINDFESSWQGIDGTIQHSSDVLFDIKETIDTLSIGEDSKKYLSFAFNNLESVFDKQFSNNFDKEQDSFEI